MGDVLGSYVAYHNHWSGFSTKLGSWAMCRRVTALSVVKPPKKIQSVRPASLSSLEEHGVGNPKFRPFERPSGGVKFACGTEDPIYNPCAKNSHDKAQGTFDRASGAFP